MAREGLLALTFVELADNLVEDFDVVELLNLLTDRCVEVLEVSTTGIMLSSAEGDLRVMASSSEAMRILELFELQSQQGPCLDCFQTGEALVNRDLESAKSIWPLFVPEALDAGFRSVHAIPMRLRGATIGVLNLFRTEAGSMDDDDIRTAQAFADIATIAIIQQRATVQAQTHIAQLTHALESRVVLEQAKGILVERNGTDMNEAFTWMRRYARSNHFRLSEVAQEIVAGTLMAAMRTPAVPNRTRRPATEIPRATEK